jgi:biotin transporter BioY
MVLTYDPATRAQVFRYIWEETTGFTVQFVAALALVGVHIDRPSLSEQPAAQTDATAVVVVIVVSIVIAGLVLLAAAVALRARTPPELPVTL